MDMDTARFSFYRILVALSMVCFAANLYSGEPLRQRTFAMDGYRPVTLPEYKIVAENPFPLSKGEKNSLLDSVSRVCRTCLPPGRSCPGSIARRRANTARKT